MSASKKDYFLGLLLIFVLMPLNHQFRFQNACAQSMLPAGMAVKKVYQAGPGLPIGKIQSVWGDAVIVHANVEEAYQAKIGLPLFRGDTMITNPNARLGCKLKDGSTVRLAADSKLKINFSAHDPQRKTSSSSLFLAAGQAYFQIARLDEYEPREFSVETHSILAGGRQADFAIFLSGRTTEIIAFKDSVLEVMSLEDPEQKIFLSEFQRAVIEGGELPSSVEILPVDQAKRILSDFQQYPGYRLSGLTNKQSGENETIGEEGIREESSDRGAYLQEFP